jgi:hypothetical protein
VPVRPASLHLAALRGGLEDIADVTTMSFLQHLEELRKRLGRLEGTLARAFEAWIG